MKITTHRSNSSIKVNNKKWLEKVYKQKKERTLILVKRSIDYLLKSNEDITLSKISKISKELDSENKGVHVNTIRTNHESYDYYKLHSSEYKKRNNSTKGNNKKIYKFDYSKLILNRDLETLKRRYSRLSKSELINRLISVEEYVIKNNQKWIQKQFMDYKNYKNQTDDNPS
ncbi:hypothetical protein [Metabacillus litoralis]|uniref:hypothetical protein n=1 Tax=Metabacillus TaxID=2675233 RepID=UPI001B97087F|nr:hypothetical protein [Metabacillus litoralis]MCM3164538.1 hypothetical protein [Metabacillus litoralis]